MRVDVIFYTSIFPLYAKRKFEIFIENINNFYLAFDKKDLRGIKQETKSKFSDKFIFLKNIWYKNRYLIYQIGVIKSIIFNRPKTVVLLGDFKIISNWIAAILCKILKIEVIFYTHGLYGNESFIKNKIRLFYYSLANKMLLYERRSKKLLIKKGIKEDKIHVIFNSLDYEKQHSLLQELQTKNVNYNNIFKYQDLPYIIFVGRLTEVKRLDMLFRSISKINYASKNLNLLIVGDGPKKKSLINLSENLNIKHHVVFYGPSYNEKELSKLIFHASVCVSPGNVGLTAIHSLTYGTPVLTHDNFNNQMPEVESITPGFNGEFFSYQCETDLSDKIKLMIKNLGKGMYSVQNCRLIIDNYYNPDFQLKVLRNVLENNKPII